MRAAMLAGLGLAEPPGQLQLGGWIERWGAGSLFDRPLTIREVARFTALLNIYRRFEAYHAGLKTAIAKGKSAGVVLFDWLESGAIHPQDYELVTGLISSGQYKPKG